MQNFGFFSTRPKLVKAKQLQAVQQFYDDRTGQHFIGQIGDWKVIDDNGNVFLMNYFEFIDRFYPSDDLAFEMFSSKQKLYAKRSSLSKKVKGEIKRIYQEIHRNDKG